MIIKGEKFSPFTIQSSLYQQIIVPNPLSTNLLFTNPYSNYPQIDYNQSVAGAGTGVLDESIVSHNLREYLAVMLLASVGTQTF